MSEYTTYCAAILRLGTASGRWPTVIILSDTGRLEGGQFMSTQGGWRVDSSCAYREVGGLTVYMHTERLEGGQFICIQGGWRVDSS